MADCKQMAETGAAISEMKEAARHLQTVAHLTKMNNPPMSPDGLLVVKGDRFVDAMSDLLGRM